MLLQQQGVLLLQLLKPPHLTRRRRFEGNGPSDSAQHSLAASLRQRPNMNG